MIFDYMFTYGGPELFMLFTVLFVTPIVHFLYLRSARWPFWLLSVAAIWLGAVVAAFGDVYMIGWEAMQLCAEEAGLHVFGTAHTDGFLGDSSIEYWSKYGFAYVESERRDGLIHRYEVIDGRVTVHVDKDKRSRYELRSYSSWDRPHFRRMESVVSDRLSQVRLGELVSFAEYPGWLDRTFLGFLGLTWSPPICFGNEPPSTSGYHLTEMDLIKAVLQPDKETEGEQG